MAEGKSGKKPSPLSPAKGRRGQGENRSSQLLILLVLALCCAASIYLYRGTTKEVDRNNNYQPVIDASKIDPTTVAEAKDVAETGSAVSSLGRARSQVMQSAMLAEISGKQPFGTSNALVAAVAVEDIPLIEEPVEAALPPSVTVVAVMIKDRDKVAMIDIAGEESALVVREGSYFSDGSARVTKIAPEGVKFTWMKKSYEASVPQ